jgi:hypothetical protein
MPHKKLEDVWDCAALAGERVFGERPIMALDTAADGRDAIVFAGCVWLYKADGAPAAWTVEVRLAHILAFRERPCLRLLNGNRSDHYGIEAALVAVFLHLAHVRTHDALDTLVCEDSSSYCHVREVGGHN